MALNGMQSACREYHFDRGASISEFTSATFGVGTVSYTANTDKGVQLMVTDAADRSFIHFNNRLAFDIDDLLSVEYLFRIEGWHANTDAILGLGSTYNADPDAIQEGVWFRIGGSTQNRTLYVESDDNVTNIDDEPTGIVLPNNAWTRARINFATGIQSIGPPGASKGGKSSVQFSVSDDKGFMRHLQFPKHIDMSGYAGGLQPIVGARQVTNNAGSQVYLYLKSMKIEFKLPA